MERAEPVLATSTRFDSLGAPANKVRRQCVHQALVPFEHSCHCGEDSPHRYPSRRRPEGLRAVRRTLNVCGEGGNGNGRGADADPPQVSALTRRVLSVCSLHLQLPAMYPPLIGLLLRMVDSSPGVIGYPPNQKRVALLSTV
eukprot:gene16835-biopygen3816